MTIIRRILQSHYIVYAIIIGVGLFWFFIAHQMYYGFGYSVGDTAVAENALWNTIHGRWFYQSFLDAENNFREHLNFVQILYLPFYYVVPHTLTLYGSIHAMFVIAGIVLYRFAFSQIGRWGALIVTAMFIFHPLVASQAVGPMHVVAVGGPFFLFMLIAYIKKCYKWFLVWLFLLVFLSEFAAPTIFMMSVLALWDRRNWKWFVPPAVGGVALYMAAKYYITIGFGAHNSIMSHFTREALEHIQKLTKRLHFVGDFLKPLAYIFPFFSRYAILLIPSIIVAIFIILPGRLKGGAHVFIFVPSILAIIFIDLAMRWHGWRKNILYGLTVCGILLSFGSWVSWMDIGGSAHADTLRQAIQYVRDGGSVTGDVKVGPALCRREEYYIPQNKKHTDYVLLKLSKNSTQKNVPLGEGNRYVDSLVQSNEYMTVFHDGRIILLIKKEKLAQLLVTNSNVIERMTQHEVQRALLKAQKQ